MNGAYPFAVVKPDWPAPGHIEAFTSCRSGGFSLPPYDEFNLGLHVGDDSDRVKRNRQQLLASCSGLEKIHWLQQVHGTRCVYADGLGSCPEADASFTELKGVACAVMTADCLPLLFCDDRGRQVAAVHAGWRGLCAGVIEAAVAAFDVAPAGLLVWLGPAISRDYFEVGAELREQFLQAASGGQQANVAAAFVSNDDKPGHYFADLYALARSRLSSLGVENIYAEQSCTYADSACFYSYRRQAVTGRMVSLIYKKP